jgi:histone deacetylase complex regulatory component SIN3
MFNIEDEMFELDLVIESAQSLVSRIKKKLQSVEYSSDTFPRYYY